MTDPAVHLLRLQTHCFRNLVDVDLALGVRFNVVAGNNAQGKTNLLEAVHLLACQRSFRAARTSEMIRFGSEAARVEGSADVGPLTRQVQLHLRPEGKRVVVDGKGTRAGSARLEGLSAVLFCPEDLQVPRGAPAERRRLVDRAITTVWPGYQQLHRDYSKTLQARNRLLRTQPAELEGLLEVYDIQLCELGAKVIVARRRYLNNLGPTFAEVYGEISKSGVVASLRYRCPAVIEAAGDRIEEVAAALRALLRQRRREELARKTTCAGPHTDDVEFLLDDQSARSYGSQGQVRSMVLSFRITEIIESHRRLDHYPMLLLDDVSSELDPERNQYLFNFIEEICCQVFLTTTRPELVPLRKKVEYFKVVNGHISHENDPLRSS